MAAQTMVANTYDRHLDICGWFADLRAELPDSSFNLHVVLKCGEEKTRVQNDFGCRDYLTFHTGRLLLLSIRC